MKKFLITVITFYQRRVSPFMRPRCKFFPSCSEYSKQAILKYGVLEGSILGIKRILRCHPWGEGGMDPLR